MSEPAWTVGGAGGAVAMLDDLAHASGALGRAADELEIAARALSVAAPPDGWGGTGPRSVALIETATACAREAADLRDLAARLGAAVRAYAEAEREANRGIGIRRALLDVAEDHVGRVAWGVRVLQSSWLLAPVAAVLAPTTDLANGVTVERAVGLTGDRFDAIAAALATAVRAAEVLEPDLLGVEPAGPGLASTAPANVEELMGRLMWLSRQPDGAVAIETVRAPGGDRHIVYIPGTQDWGVWDGNPADLQSNLDAVTGGPSDAATSVVAALRSHGISPDEPVMLVGHSQGGMVATVLAAQLSSRYRVTPVVTAGAPTGRLALPSRVQALHLENVRDVVPGLDGKPNPATPTRVTVIHDRRHTQLDRSPNPSRTVLQSHAIVGYAQTARLVDAGFTPSARVWSEGARTMLAGGSAHVTAYRPVTR